MRPAVSVGGQYGDILWWIVLGDVEIPGLTVEQLYPFRGDFGMEPFALTGQGAAGPCNQARQRDVKCVCEKKPVYFEGLLGPPSVDGDRVDDGLHRADKSRLSQHK